MTVSGLIAALNDAIAKGTIKTDSEILATTLNGSQMSDEMFMFENIGPKDRSGIYMLLTGMKNDTENVLFTVYEKEETKE